MEEQPWKIQKDNVEAGAQLRTTLFMRFPNKDRKQRQVRCELKKGVAVVLLSLVDSSLAALAWLHGILPEGLPILEQNEQCVQSSIAEHHRNRYIT